MASIQEDKRLDKLKRICLSKVAHKHKLAAEYALDEMVRLPYSAKLDIYTCPICGLFHIGKASEYQRKKYEDENGKDIPDNNSYTDSLTSNTLLSMAKGEEECEGADCP